jgi:hypothetical protein
MCGKMRIGSSGISEDKGAATNRSASQRFCRPNIVTPPCRIGLPKPVTQNTGTWTLSQQAHMEHYHTERPHQGLGNEITEPPPQGKGKIVCPERFGGLLKFYQRAA